MRPVLLPLLAALGMMGGGISLLVPPSDAPAVPVQEAETDPFGELVTLWANDVGSAAFDFGRGAYGGRLEDGQILYDEAHVVFHQFEPNHLSLAFARDSVANVVDLGPSVINPIRNPRHHAPKPPLPLFFCLFHEAKRDRFVIHGTTRGETRLRAADPVLRPLQRSPIQHVAPGLGHTYLMRFKSDVRNAQDILIKMLIVDLQPDRYLTFRWQRLR